MNKKIRTTNQKINRIIVKWTCLLLVFTPGVLNAAELLGFQQMATAIDGRAVKLLYKLEGDRFELKYDQPGDFELTLEPAELFLIDKTGPNTFIATITNPKGMWVKHEDEPFKLKWLMVELID